MVAALLQAVPQESTGMLQNGLVEMRNRTVWKSLNDAQYNQMNISTWNHESLVSFHLIKWIYQFFRNMGKLLIFLLLVFFVSAPEKAFWCPIWWVKLALSRSGDTKGAAYEGRNGWKCVYFPTKSASSVFIVNVIKVFSPFCTLTWCVNNYLFHREKIKIAEMKVLIFWWWWKLNTFVRAWFNNFVRISWLPLIGGYFPRKGEKTISLNSRNVFKNVKFFSLHHP